MTTTESSQPWIAWGEDGSEGDVGRLAAETTRALRRTPEPDGQDDEPASVTDGLFAIARAIDRLADVLAGREGSDR